MKDEEKKENPVEDAGESKPEEKKPEEPTGAEQVEKMPPETPPVGEKPADSPSDASQGEENGEGAKPENPDAPPEVPEEKPDTQPSEEAPAVESTNDELLLARAELSAIKSGMSVSVAEDAVVLAMHDLKKDGAVPDQAGLEKALKGVLKRHPEWDAKKQQGTPAGFKVGADGSQNQNSAADDTISRAFGNK